MFSPTEQGNSPCTDDQYSALNTWRIFYLAYDADYYHQFSKKTISQVGLLMQALGRDG